MSTAPNRSMVAATHAATWSGSPALAANTAVPPPISADAASSASCLRDDSITDAPAPAYAAAMALPMPRLAPVTSATLPSSVICMGGEASARTVDGMNRLAAETSPYLRQHAGNPVDWYAWGDEAFAAAKEADRPILLSVGYSSCHWCHVMAHESFEDPEVAGLMNDLFVNIKVDREERPDVDEIYMEADEALTGGGGWAMTGFLTHEGGPSFG